MANRRAQNVTVGPGLNLVATGSNLQEIENNVNMELPKLLEWLRSNRLSLNIKKKHVMVFGNKSNKIIKENQPKIVIDGETLEIVNETKFLGVYLDSALNWKKHINYIFKKRSKIDWNYILGKSNSRQKTSHTTVLFIHLSIPYIL